MKNTYTIILLILVVLILLAGVVGVIRNLICLQVTQTGEGLEKINEDIEEIGTTPKHKTEGPCNLTSISHPLLRKEGGELDLEEYKHRKSP